MKKINIDYLTQVQIVPEGKQIFQGRIDTVKSNIEEFLNYTIDEYLSENIPDYCIDYLLEIANDGFGIEMSREDIENHIKKSQKVFLLKVNSKIVGFSSLSSLEDFVYRFGTVIKKEFQGKGMYKKLSEAILQNDKKYFLRTQNKNVINSLKKTFSNVLIGKEALNYITKNFSKEELEKFFLEHGDKEKTLNDDGIFKEVYGASLAGENKIDNLGEKDSILVVYFNKNKNEL